MNEEVRQRELDREMKIKENEKDRHLFRETSLASTWSKIVSDSTAACNSVGFPSPVNALGDSSNNQQKTIEVQYLGTNDDNTDSPTWPALITFTDFSSLKRLSHLLVEGYLGLPLWSEFSAKV